MSVQIFWDPKGLELDSLGSKKFLRATDGDTPYVSISIRMLSIDTPEVHYPGNQKPSKHDKKLTQLGEWLKEGKVPIKDSLAEYLYPKLASGKAGSLQEKQGRLAAEYFRKLLEKRLSDPQKKRKRGIFLRTADKPFDRYGRLLAYMAPYYTPEERARMSRKDRATFNLLMVESGWAAPFLIYPSLPRYQDLVLFWEAAKRAFEERDGAWAEPLMLTGYEFRMCVRLYEVMRKLIKGKRLSSQERKGWITRYCADLTTCKIYEPQDYHRVPPYNRLFIWPEDVTEAVGRLNLVSGY
ncbi:nuclease [Thermosulfuriphilus ammonigenes]|uniref:Nuclease n=1 Tax=Thermosulfuriphilus ammonigenes TaxID=1936021 RepID=A0A6G7PVD9_9BACT|nr:thermonuclease family protein [Thermosulfuriphilus ammonigenes]MBA2848456.1 endonuclease YncB(thermonuclease family) [Thermosulfuriphilus ammonigenes]QIJ71393.1 nuclease [Thermosulfuriphilus ammonigenes]